MMHILPKEADKHAAYDCSRHILGFLPDYKGYDRQETFFFFNQQIRPEHLKRLPGNT